jgi:hypothetical protein
MFNYGTMSSASDHVSSNRLEKLIIVRAVAPPSGLTSTLKVLLARIDLVRA